MAKLTTRKSRAPLTVRLGLEKVYVQAKRWKGSVGRPEVQGFYGALAGSAPTGGCF